MKAPLLSALVTLGLWTAAAIPASAQYDLLGVQTTSSVLWDIDAGSGAGSNPRSTGVDYIVGIAASPDGTLYGLTTFASTPPNSLITIDPVSGSVTTIGATGLSNIFEGDLAIDPTTGVLYGIQDFPGGGGLWMFSIDSTNGAATLIGEVVATVDDLSAMSFDSAGNCYMIDTDRDVLYLVNKATAAVISSTFLSTPLGGAAGMAFHPSTDVLYVADGYTAGTNKLWTCNTTTGILTEVGPLGITDGLMGLAFHSVCDEPATATFRNDVGNTNPSGYLASAPIMGTTWTASVDNTLTGNTLAHVVGYSTPLSSYLANFGDYLLVNAADPNGELLGISASIGTGVVTFGALVPSDSALCGFSLATQGYGFGGPLPRLHNAFDLVVGSY